jgi:NAD(P)-dependent dehydrogenase (short-subunit alcohol dehydrogenase family)
MRRVVVTGAARGLGLEFCRQFLELGDGVIAIVRAPAGNAKLDSLQRAWPETLHVRVLDVTDFEHVAEFGEELASFPVHILVNNAGEIGPETHKGESGQAFHSISLDLLERLYRVNSIAPLYLTQALFPSLRLAGNARTFVLGSTVGVAKETFGDYYAYRMSKAAVHVAFATLAKDLAQFSILAGVICPGWVRTELGGPQASMEPDDSVRMMIDVMLNFSPEQSGRFVGFDGRVLDF